MPLRISEDFTRGMGHGAKDCGMDVGWLVWRNFNRALAEASATGEEHTWLGATANPDVFALLG